ncbi:unnamed protein product [Ranitomeya imitator]|uniref:CS domain-containing protein n=1 Tax=Ranitomeya imitator TaxID=111125 RepID=A0ABN9LRR9_9NEOB|nr:unnamed protein product [Ranitomeya imitator]
MAAATDNAMIHPALLLTLDTGPLRHLTCGRDPVHAIPLTAPHHPCTSAATTPLPLDIQITFEGKKEFSKRLELWGVINTENCFVNMLPTKVEITLKKSEAVTWARLELTVAPPQVTDEADPQEPEGAPPVDIGRDSDDDLSWSEDEEPCD